MNKCNKGSTKPASTVRPGKGTSVTRKPSATVRPSGGTLVTKGAGKLVVTRKK